MNRRRLLLGLGGALAAPAIVRAESLMKLWVPPKLKLVASLDTLEDYDEGFWAPVAWVQDRQGYIFEYVSSSLRYTKIGRTIFVDGKVFAA